MAATRLTALWNHPAGPKTIHFWAPAFKWGLSIANIADFTKPTDMISYPQQSTMTATGLIWARYSMVVIPVLRQNLRERTLMAATGIFQLSRKFLAEEFGSEKGEVNKVEKQAA
ncbi:hypothetical protein R1flu_012823 [Riccia fluitans]|uniref:Mitochondrial pyruvate carrier n=1 Tax=Riccia fluitans TaxID=41844 RepID=A0ABD1ZBV8_9MARC